MNLITDPWIPVIREDGRIVQVAPWQIAEPENPIIELAAARPDFQGSLYQFLIGLLQTCSAPEDMDAWAAAYDDPPASQQLAADFMNVASAFELNSEIGKPAFMQDLTLEEAEKKAIATLLIDAPGEQTIESNKDVFVKRGQVNAMCPTCTALALFTLQTNAPSGGSGHRVGLRGGGPLTTLVQPVGQSTLWQKLWLNVLTQEAGLNQPWKCSDATVFPWMGATQCSSKGEETFPQDGHPLQVYWGMPRRIRLLDSHPQDGVCDVCGAQSSTLFSHFVTRTYGINYAGAWLHPLTPYRTDQKYHENPPLSLKGQKGGVGYRHWLGLVLEDQDKGDRAAQGVQALLSEKAPWLPSGKQLQLWCFGYDMDKMKARCWYDQCLPMFTNASTEIVKLQAWVQELLTATNDSVYLLRSQVKEAWYRHKQGAGGDFSFIDAEFWQVTEKAFYQQVQTLAQASALDSLAPAEVYAHWFHMLEMQVKRLFDQFTLQTTVEGLDLSLVIKARYGLLSKFYKKPSIKQLKAKGQLTKESNHD